MILDKIKALCAQKKTTISAVEQAVGLGQGTIYKWGRVSPSADNLKRVADYFGVPVDALLREEATISAKEIY